MEGYLNKWTNFLKGWQQRYFVLDKDTGKIKYYLTLDEKKNGLVRGELYLSVSNLRLDESEKDVFIVESKNIVYKLQATSIQLHHEWVSLIQNTILELKSSNPKPNNILDDSNIIDFHLTESASISTNIPPISSRNSDKLPHQKIKFKTLRNEKSTSNVPKVHPQSIDNPNFDLHIPSFIEHKNREINIIEEAENLKENLIKLNTNLKDFKAKIENSSPEYFSKSSKAILILEAIIEKTLHVYDAERCKLFQMVRKTKESKDLQLYQFSRFVIDAHIDVKTSHFGSFQDFIYYMRKLKFPIAEKFHNIKSFPAQLFQTRSMVEILALTFSHSQAIIELSTISDDPLLQILSIIKAVCCMFKSFLKDQNFNGIPIPSGEYEFFRFKIDKNLYPDIDPNLSIICQYIKKNHNGYYLLHLQDLLKSISINIVIIPSLSFSDGNLTISLEGQGRLVLINHKKEYSFTFPDIIIKNILFAIPSISYAGEVKITCLRSNITANLHFLNSSRHEEFNKLIGFIHLPAPEYKFIIKGFWDKALSIYNQENDLINFILIDIGRSFNRFIPSTSSQHLCESRRLWTKAKKAIKSKDDDKFLLSIAEANLNLQNNSNQLKKIFKNIEETYILNTSFLC